MDGLVDKSAYITFGILLIFTWHELVSVPDEIYVESWNEEGQRRGTHKVEKATAGGQLNWMRDKVFKKVLTRDISPMHVAEQVHQFQRRSTRVASILGHTSFEQKIPV